MIRRGKLKRKYKDFQEKVLLWCDRVPYLTDEQNTEVFQLLVRDEIDIGEADLLSRLFENSDYLLLTGDKKALRALATNEDLKGIRQGLSGRVICLEVAIEILVRKVGVKKVAAAFAPLCPHNQTLGIVFSRGEETAEADCLSALCSYVNELGREVDPGFLYRVEADWLASTKPSSLG